MAEEDKAPLVDITGWFQREDKSVICAQAHGSNVLILYDMDKPVKRFDGQKVRLRLEYRWLSKKVESATDENWVCVRGQEYTYWKRSEVPLKGLATGKVTLFDAFSLF